MLNEAFFHFASQAQAKIDSTIMSKLVAMEVVGHLVFFMFIYYKFLLKFGLKLAQFISYFVNYNFSVTYNCQPCNYQKLSINLPHEPSR